MTEINEIISTLVPVFVTAIVCPSICVLVYYLYKVRLSFGTNNTKHIYTDKKKKKGRRERN